MNHPMEENYNNLSPDLVLDSIESQGFSTDARVAPLNSYENRVYQVGIEGSSPIIAKFYRPCRWDDAAILEEHSFTRSLAELEIPVIAPIADEAGQTLRFHQGYRFSLCQRQGGQAPEPGDFDQINWLGRLLGRIHAVGKASPFAHRPTLSIETFAIAPSQFILENQFLPMALEKKYEQVTSLLHTGILEIFNSIEALNLIRCHGDCHIGNILWHRETGPWFVDFDDCRMAPAVQDLWMLLEGNRMSQIHQLAEILDGYTEFCEFNTAELRLIEPLRSLRMIHYAGWLAKRWTDPAFPKSFTWFNTPNYWPTHIAELEEQLLALEKSPLQWF